MTQTQSALSTLITELLNDPDMAHDQVFRRMLQAGLQDYSMQKTRRWW